MRKSISESFPNVSACVSKFSVENYDRDTLGLVNELIDEFKISVCPLCPPDSSKIESITSKLISELDFRIIDLVDLLNSFYSDLALITTSNSEEIAECPLINTILKLRLKDKYSLGNRMLEKRLVLSELVTNTSADGALRYVWANRALAQSTPAGSTAITHFGIDSPSYVGTREATLHLRETYGLANPFQVSTQDDLDVFLNQAGLDQLVIKQNYPSANAELARVRGLDFRGVETEDANTVLDYKIVESKECLARLALLPDDELEGMIRGYLDGFIDENDIDFTNDDFDDLLDKIFSLVRSLLLKSRLYTGDIPGLLGKVEELLAIGVLPVFKFEYSISGFGVFYPKDDEGRYDKEKLIEIISDPDRFMLHVSDALSKNGQVLSSDDLRNIILEDGLVLQEYLTGVEHSAGYYKPLPSEADDFHFNTVDMVLTDVIAEGENHLGNVLRYGKGYIGDILDETTFDSCSGLFHYVIEVILYLMYLNEGKTTSFLDFRNIRVEDFGIQFIVDDETGRVGLVEFNGRTPSCNFNHYYVKSLYGSQIDEVNLPEESVVFTNAALMTEDEFEPFLDDVNSFVDKLVEEVKCRYGDRCQLVAFQISNAMLTVNFGLFLDEDSVVDDELHEIMSFFQSIFK